MASKYPNGFKHGLSVRGVPLVQTHAGHVFWVSNSSVVDSNQATGSDSNDGTFDRPFATLDYAVGQCTANRGDVIFVKPKHAETYSAASALALDVAGIAIIGLGNGDLRPTFTLDTVDTTQIVCSAANVSMQNMIFIANFLSIAQVVKLTTAKGFSFEMNEIRDTSAALNFLNVIKSTGAANTVDRLYVADNFYGSIGTTFNTLVLTANDIDNLQVHRNTVLSINTTDQASLVVVTAGVLTNGFMSYNVSKRKNTTTSYAMVNVGGTTSSVIMFYNFASALDGTNNINWVTTTGLVGVGNTYSGAIAGQGFVIPALDS